MKTPYHFLPSSLLFMIACLIFVPGCASLRMPSLETTINSFYRAEQIHDWKTVWSLTHPMSKEAMLKEDGTTYKEFVKDLQEKEDDLVSWRILRIEETRDINTFLTLGVGATRTVKVAMDVTVYYKDTKKTSKAYDQTDYWIQQDGRWLWFFRGWP